MYKIRLKMLLALNMFITSKVNKVRLINTIYPSLLIFITNESIRLFLFPLCKVINCDDTDCSMNGVETIIFENRF